MNRFSKSETEESAAPYRYEPLFGLEVDGSVGNGRLVVGEKIVDAFGNVGQGIPLALGGFSETVYRERKNREYPDGNENVLDAPASHEKHNDRDRGDEQDGSKIRLERQKEHDRTQKRHVGQVSPLKGGNFAAAALKKIGEVQYRRKFHEFDRLKRKWKERQIDPPLRPIVFDSDEKHD